MQPHPTAATPFPRVVILTGSLDNPPACRLVPACIAAGRPLAGVIIDTPPPAAGAPDLPPGPRYLRYIRHGMLRYAAAKLSRGVAKRLRRRREPRLDALCARAAIPLRHVENINAPSGIEQLRALRPDVLVMMGCRILSKEVLGTARLAMNYHTGMLPDYRGSDSIYWAMASGDLDRVGFTIHEGVEQLDAGRIFHEEAVRPRPGEMIEEIYMRCVDRATPHWLRLLERYAREGDLPGRPLDLARGKVWRRADPWDVARLEAAWLRGRLPR